MSFNVSFMTGSTWTSWSKRPERRKSKSQVVHKSVDKLSAGLGSVSDEGFLSCLCLRSGRAWLRHSQSGCQFCPWTKGRAWIFSELGFFFQTLMELYLFTDHILLTVCYRDPRDLPVCRASMDLQARSARRDQRGHLEYL